MQETSDLKERLLIKDLENDEKPQKVGKSETLNKEYNTSEHDSEKYFNENLKNEEYLDQMLSKDFQNGVNIPNQADIEGREKEYGNIQNPPEKEKSIIDYILNCFKYPILGIYENILNLFEDPMLGILLIASIISLIIGGAKDGLNKVLIEGTAIFLSLILVEIIDYFTDYQDEKLLEEEEVEDFAEPTPLKRQLNKLSDLIGNRGYFFAILIGCTFLVKESIFLLLSGGSILSSKELNILVNAFIISVTVIIVATPKRLSKAVAIAFSLKKKKKEHILVKHIKKLEALGNVNNICINKATLTLD